MSDLNWNRSSDSANGPTIRRMRGKVLDVSRRALVDPLVAVQLVGDCVSVCTSGLDRPGAGFQEPGRVPGVVAARMG
jgi:hypothetical protein